MHSHMGSGSGVTNSSGVGLGVGSGVGANNLSRVTSGVDLLFGRDFTGPGYDFEVKTATFWKATLTFIFSGDATRQSKSSRAALTLSVGRMHQWMCLVKVGKFISEYAAIFLTAGIEAVLEEVVEQCLKPAAAAPSDSSREAILEAAALEQVVASSAELWAIFQPYAHLSSAR
jgi:opacity protein-like surface antigen